MGYENSKIYKLQCESGHFYIGSTYATLAERFRKHKVKSTTAPDRIVYKHINNEWDKVKIILIESFSCESKPELLKKEDEHIQRELKNPLCLNQCRAYGTDRQATYKKSREAHKDDRNAQSRAYNDANKKRIAEKRKTIRDAENARRRELRAEKKFEEGVPFIPRGARNKLIAQ